MNPGKRRHIVTFQQRTKGTDAHGGTIYVWSDVSKVFAEKVDLRGRELMAAKAAQSEVTTLFRVPYKTGLTTAMRIACGDAYYDIDSILEVGQRRGLEIMAKTGASAG